MKRLPAFTLAEVLIALALLGVIAAFTIPKIIASNNKAQYRAIGKEAMASISEAYRAYQLEYNGEVPLTTTAEDLMLRMNGLGRQTIGRIDAPPKDAASVLLCANASLYCLRLHNGAVLLGQSVTAASGYSFGSKAPEFGLNFVLDPNGKFDNDLSSLGIWLYYNGKITTNETMLDPTYRPTNPTYNWATILSGAGADPSWFDF